SSSDCYVSLWLPSASNKHSTTKAIPNTSNPIWNENFHFIIQPKVKNDLELKLYDQDVVTKDDLLYTVTYDTANIRPGETVYEKFILNAEQQETLEVELKMEDIYGSFERILTNGILTAREVSCVEVQMDKEKNAECLKKHKNIQLRIKESFEETQKITQDSGIFKFHYIKKWEPMLKAEWKNDCLEEKLFGDRTPDCPGVPLKAIPLGEKIKVSLPLIKNEHLEVQLKVNDCLGELDVRLGCSLCGAEQDFLQKRKKLVARALGNLLLLDQELQGPEVPVIAVMATGGGVRAMSSLYGHLFALQKQNLLDCVTYLTGASGSTWTLRNLYEDTDWSQKNLMGPILKARKYITRSKSSAFTLEALQHYKAKLRQRAQEGHSISFTDVWSLIIDHMLHEERESKLSDQQQTVNQGQNPLPIYVALSVKGDTQSTSEFKEWCEFSPYEVGFSKYGAFIRSEDFGSDFYMGRLMKKKPESTICYLEGIWSNIFSLNLVDVWSFYKFWQWPFPNEEEGNDDEDHSLSAGQTSHFTPLKDRSNIINGVLTHRPIQERTSNFLRGLQLHKDYYQHETFSMWKDSALDQCPNHLTPLEKELCLVDAGYFINTSCPPLLRKERNVDVILSFDYNLLETRFNVRAIEQTLPGPENIFSKIVLSEEDKKNPKECYVFEDKGDPKAPVILHFPLVNASFREYKKPGVKRTSAEMAKGELDLDSLMSPYKMTDLTYSEDEFDKLVNLSDYNVQNNRELILQALRTAVDRKKNINILFEKHEYSIKIVPLFSFAVSASDCYVTLHLPTASHKQFRTHTIKNSGSPVWNETFFFRIQTEIKNILELKVCNANYATKDDTQFTVLFDLAKVQPGATVLELFSLKPEVRNTWLHLLHMSQNLDVRLGYDLCADEQDFLHKRKKIVANALKKIFHLRQDLREHEVPVVAVMATGGGLRAMTALYGHLLALQKLNLLDCISYITTASGSTWTLTDLYKNADWSHTCLEEPIEQIKRQMMKSKESIISFEKLKYYHKELVERAEKGHLPSFTALWAIVQEAVLHDKPNDCRLSEQRPALKWGQNPFPVYTAINVKDRHVSTFDFREWVDFNPYEVGFPKYGAYICTEDFDSEFFMGKVVKRIPESRICYLEGIWTNIFSRNLLDGLYWSSTPAEFWERWIKDMTDKNDGYTTVYKPPSSASGKLCEIFNDILTDRPLKGATHNFLRSLAIDEDYLQHDEFRQWKDTVLDVSPSKLTPMEKTLCLIDIGYFINNSGPPLLKPERNVDVIIALDYEMGVPFKQAEMLAKYCEVQGIPFPKIEPSEEDRRNPKECYMFSDEDNPKAPIVLCFPLVCCTFKEYKAPGVKRSPSEMKEGEVDLDRKTSPYTTIHITYSEDNFDKLLNLSTYNILCSKDCIFQAIQCAMEKKQNTWPRNFSTSSS
ncbi:hypothetical protein JRQ81_000756, partial [Phrynocephalus forsythii]